MSTAHQWILESTRNFNFDVGSLVPTLFDSYARVFHPAGLSNRNPEKPDAFPVSWHKVAAANHKVAHPGMEWGSIVGSWHMNGQPGLWDGEPIHGELPAREATELARIFAEHSHTTTVFYALWEGYQYELAGADILDVPDRRMYVISESITKAANPFGDPDPADPFRVPNRTANMWWPTTHQWCVATDIDRMTTYIGGSAECIHDILNSDVLEALPVTVDQRITWDADTINPLPDRP